MRHSEADLKPHKRAYMKHESRFEALEGYLRARSKQERSDLKLERVNMRPEMAGLVGWLVYLLPGHL